MHQAHFLFAERFYEKQPHQIAELKSGVMYRSRDTFSILEVAQDHRSDRMMAAAPSAVCARES